MRISPMSFAKNYALCIMKYALFILFLLPLTASAQQMIQHPWHGKRVAYFGDSITDPRNKAAAHKYWYYLQEWLQISPYVYGVSGRQWNDIPRQTDKCWQEHADSLDAIIIFMGTNDFNNNVPLGQWYQESEQMVEAARGEPKHLQKRLQRLPDMNKDTFRGRINIALDKLKRLYPTKQIVLLTPIHRAGFYPNENNWQPTEQYANKIGLFISDYIQVVKEAANIWAVPVLDWSATSGLYPLHDEHAQYFNDAATDRLHPNDTGHQRLARTLMYQLLALPCTF